MYSDLYIGPLVGSTSTNQVTVRIKGKMDVNLEDLVLIVSRNNYKYLGVVIKIFEDNPLLSSRLPDIPRDIGSVYAMSYMNAVVSLLGIIREKVFEPMIPIPPSTGSPVYRVNKKLLENLNIINSPIYIGFHKFSGWSVPLNPDAVNYHIAIVGRTGCGKSHAVRILIDELVRIGRKVIVFDHSGRDYVPFFRDKYMVISDREIIPNISSIASIITSALGVYQDSYSRDYIEIATYLYSISGGDIGEAEKLLKSISSLSFKSFKKNIIEKTIPFQEIIEELEKVASKINLNKIIWDNHRFYQILASTINIMGGRGTTMIKMVLKLIKSAFIEGRLNLNRFSNRKYTAEKIAEILLNEDTKCIVLDVSNETIEVRRGIVSDILDRLWFEIEEKLREINVAVVIDEAQNYASDTSFPSKYLIARTAREGRKWRFGLILASQRWISDLDTEVRSNIGSIIMGPLQTMNDLKEISGIINIYDINPNIMGRGDFYIAGLLNPFNRPILIHTFPGK